MSTAIRVTLDHVLKVVGMVGLVAAAILGITLQPIVGFIDPGFLATLGLNLFLTLVLSGIIVTGHLTVGAKAMRGVTIMFGLSCISLTITWFLLTDYASVRKSALDSTCRQLQREMWNGDGRPNAAAIFTALNCKQQF